MADSKRGGYIRIRNSPAQHYNCSRVGAREREREKIISKQSPVVGKRERKQNKICRSVFFFFFFDMFTAIVPVMEVRRYNFTGDRSLI
jgi:hypothetical protein